MGSCASRQAIHTEQAFGSLGTWEAARRDSENGVDAIHSRSEVEHLPQPLKMKSAWPSADQQQRTSESSPGTTTIVLVASSSMSHGRVGCINCGKHRLYIAEVKLHSMGARHPKQLARLMQVLLEWDPAFAAQLESFAALLPPQVIPEGSTAAGIDSVATGASGPVVTRRQGSGLLRRSSLGTAAAGQAGRLLLVQLPPDAAAALPALASPLHALSLSMTSWQPPEPGAAPVPAILVQHTSVSALGMAAHRSGSTVQDSADSVQQEASSKAHKAQPPGALAVGLSARLLRLVSTLDALPSLVTLCTVEGQILYQNASSLQYTGSPAARAAAASAQASNPGKVKTSSSFLADLLQLQPEVLEELLETVVVGADVWSQVVRVPELLAVEAPSGPAAPHRMSMCLARNSSVLSAAADASMAKAMGMLMVAPAMAAAAASITAGHRPRARTPWQTSNNGLPEASQPSMCAVARSLPSFTAKAQPQRRQALPAEPLTSQVWDKTSAPCVQSPYPHPAPFVRKAPVRKQVSRKASSSWLTQALSNPPPPKARSSVSSLDSPAPHDAPGAHALASLRTQQLRDSPRMFHTPPASPAPPTTSHTLPSRHPSSQVSLGHVSLKQRSGSEDSVRGSSAACSGAGTPLPVSGPRQRLLSLLSMVDREAHSTGRRASSEPKDGAGHPGQTVPPADAGQPVPVRSSLLQSRSGVPAPGSQAASTEASESHGHSLHCFGTSDLKTAVEVGEGGKWQQTERRLRFDAVPRQEPAPAGGGTAEERSSARQQDTEGFPTSLHEVTVTAVTDPETQQQVLLVVQTDVSERSAVEERLMALTAAQMTMLEAMFPRHIMEQIASHGATSNLTEKASGGNGWQNVATMDLSKLATHHECVTIMFTDIVGFTAFSKECTPGQVMSFLNELFSKMDGLLDKHNVYKVETAGDCYIICGGLLDEDEDGFKTVASGSPTRVAKIKAARRALNFAVEMMRVASTVMMPNTGKPVVLRAGLHSGPVVSGLVGSRLPKFSLFGDTMNTASRMESTSVPGRIQVSQATYELLRDPRPSRWQPTGGVQVKGKGLMHTYLMAEEVTRMRRTSTAGAPPDTLPTGSAALVDSAARCKSSTSLVALQQAAAAAAAAAAVMGPGGVAAVDTWDTNSWLLPPSEQLGSSVHNSSLSTLHLSCQPLDSPVSGDLSAMMASLADPTTAPYTSHTGPGVAGPSPAPPPTASSPPGQASPCKASPAANIAKPAVGSGPPAQGCSLLTLPGSTVQLDSAVRSDECSSPRSSPRPGSALTFRAPLGASSPLARSQRRTPSSQAWGPAGVGGTAEHLMASLAVRGDEHMLGMPDAPQSALTSGLDTEASCISLLGDSACNTLASHSQSSMPSMDTLVMNIALGSLPPGAEAAPPLSSSRRMSREAGAPAGAAAGASTPLWDCLPGSSVRHDMEPMPDLKEEEEEEEERREGEEQAVQVPKGGQAAATQTAPLLLPCSIVIPEPPQPASPCPSHPHLSLPSAEAPQSSNPVFDSDSHILDQLHHIQAESPRSSSRFRSLTPCSSSLGPRPPPQRSGSTALLPRSAPRDPQRRASTTLVEAGVCFSPLASSCGASTPAEHAGLAQVGSAPTGYLMKAQPRHAPVRPSGKYAAAGVAGAKTAFGSPSIAPLLPVSRLLAPPPASPTPAPDPSFDAISTRNPGSPHPGTQTPGPGQAPRPQPRPGPLEGTVTPLPPTQTAESELGPPPAPGSPLASTPPLTSSPNTSCPMTRRGLPKSREGYK